MRGTQALQELSYKTTGFIKKNSPTILTSMGAVGVVATSVMTAKATTKVNRILDEAKHEKGEDLTKKEKLILSGPIYIPVVLMGAATISCMFGADILSKKKQASLISAYTLLDRSYKEYRSKVEQLYGNDSNEYIKEEIAKDKYEEQEVKKEDGKLFYDEYSKRYFRSTIEKVQRAEYQLNRNLVMRDYVYLNEFYEDLGIDTIEAGYSLGWSIGANLDMYWQEWVDFNHGKIEMEDGEECHIIYMLMEPIPNFENYS